MTESIDPTRSARPVSVPSQEEMVQRQQRDKNKSAAEDRVSLGEQEEVGKTYGPGLKVASLTSCSAIWWLKPFKSRVSHYNSALVTPKLISIP